MSDDEISTKDTDGEVLEDEAKTSETLATTGDSEVTAESAAPTNLGATKYVHAAFFVVGIVTAFVAGPRRTAAPPLR